MSLSQRFLTVWLGCTSDVFFFTSHVFWCNFLVEVNVMLLSPCHKQVYVLAFLSWNCYKQLHQCSCFVPILLVLKLSWLRFIELMFTPVFSSWRWAYSLPFLWKLYYISWPDAIKHIQNTKCIMLISKWSICLFFVGQNAQYSVEPCKGHIEESNLTSCIFLSKCVGTRHEQS